MDIEIKDGKDYLEKVKSLIAEYTQRLGRSLSFQDRSPILMLQTA